MEEINIKDFLQVILKKLWLIILVGLLFMGAIFVYDKYIKIPLYESSATLVLTKNDTNKDSTIDQNDISVNQKLVYTYSELVKSKLVLNQTIKNLNLNIKTKELAKLITVENVENTEILKISVKYTDAPMAKTITNEIASVFSEEIVNIYKMNNVSIIDLGVEAKTVCNDTTIRDLLIGFILGCALSIGIITVIYYFDDTIKLSENLEEEINIPVVGKVINQYKDKKQKDNLELVVDKYPKSLVSEGIKSLRTNLSFSSVDNELKTILITSSIPGEGKSFISSNLATAFAQTGKNVLLVDCDMRKGRQHKIFNIANTKGFSDLIVDNVHNYKKFIKPTKIRKLSVLPCGTIPPNPSELLDSYKNKKLLGLLKESYDLIIFDGVPCNGLPDSLIMSTLVDKTLIVSSERVTPKELLNNTRKSLENVKANIAGVIINKVNVSNNKYYGKYYTYYGDEK